MDVASPTTPKDGLSKGKPRTLTQAQRERKRAADRKSVRQARAKTKNYVAHLEQLLADTASPGDSDRTSRLLCRLNQNFTEINRLKESLAAIRDIAQTALDDGSANKDSLTRASSAALCESTCNNSADDGPSAQNGAGSHAAIEAGTEETSSSNTWPPLDIIGLASFDLADKLTLPTSLSQLSGLDTAAAGFHAPDPLLDGRLQIPPAGGKAQAPQPSSDLQCSNDTRYIWDSLGYYTLNALQSAMASAWTPDSVRDADIMITAVVHGWDAVPAKYQWLDATWQVLQHTDQHILTGCGIVERFAMLYIMKLKLHVSWIPNFGICRNSLLHL